MIETAFESLSALCVLFLLFLLFADTPAAPYFGVLLTIVCIGQARWLLDRKRKRKQKGW